MRAVAGVSGGLSRASNKRELFALAPYVFGSALASLIPRKLYIYPSTVAGAIGYVTNSDRRNSARAAQALAGGPSVSRFEIERRTCAAFISYFQYWMESLAITTFDREELKVGLSVEGEVPLLALTKSGAGAIVATAHFGNWDWGGSWVGSFVHPFSAVVEPLKPDVLADWFFDHRRELGIEPILLDGSVAKQVIAGVRAGRIVALVSDRDLSGTGVEVQFFGRTVKMPSGAAVLALRTKTPIFPGIVYMSRRGEHLIKFLDPIYPGDAIGGDLSEKVAWLTQAVSSALESLIRVAPTQWHVMQPLPVLPVNQ